ncbi:MAG TPA: agmatine deiminase family protein [Chthoniobacteraceae bacterium]|jgi:agmatine deiminase|nr:agmatine deiminase family protein [Chthoniobacteraceae bacterium]
MAETSQLETPAALGYRMPAEWEPHAATWLSWPRRDGISFPDSYDRVMPVFAKMVDALADSEPVHINVCDAAHEKDVRAILSRRGARASHVKFHLFPTNEPWCRDHGPIFITRQEAPQLAITDWDYNAWGWKYPPFDDDDVVPSWVAEEYQLPIYRPGMVLEGGSIEVNGRGSLLTTTSCLLNPNRNPELTQADIEQRLKDFLGVRNVLWLGDGIEGDDTDGHIDDLTRFVSPHSVVTVIEEDEGDANFQPLQDNLAALHAMATEDEAPLEVQQLPMPHRIMRDGLRLPASYANFYIANKVVLLPVFADAHDKWAIAVVEKAFPERKVLPIDCRELIWGLGAFHCLTQQQPKV